MRSDIQGLRGIAILLVMLYHSGVAVPNGYMGVDVFFVISGYVITASILRELENTGRVSLVDFFFRRAKRLLPALGIVIVSVLIASSLLQSPFFDQEVTAKTAVAAIAFVANLYFLNQNSSYFERPAETNPLFHTWSLSVEEQFYLCFPIFIVFLIFISKKLSVNSEKMVFYGVLTISIFGFFC